MFAQGRNFPNQFFLISKCAKTLNSSNIQYGNVFQIYFYQYKMHYKHPNTNHSGKTLAEIISTFIVSIMFKNPRLLKMFLYKFKVSLNSS